MISNKEILYKYLSNTLTSNIYIISDIEYEFGNYICLYINLTKFYIIILKDEYSTLLSNRDASNKLKNKLYVCILDSWFKTSKWRKIIDISFNYILSL